MVMCMESVYVVGGCSVVAFEHAGRYSLSCMQKLGRYGMLGALSYVVKFYCDRL